MAEQTYHQFCPVAMAAEILCTRWTVVLLRELLAGNTRFNGLRRGLPRISPALLSQRLKELEGAGIVERRPIAAEPGAFEYHLTPAGQELGPLVESFGRWGQRWVSSELSLKRLDATLLVWDMHRNLRLDPPPSSRQVVKIAFTDAPPNEKHFWLVATPDQCVDFCRVDPGHDVDLYVHAELSALTAVWMGLKPFAEAVEEERVRMTGERSLVAAFPRWLKLSPFASEERMVA
jgi:DNA-binding HxlR family transcriptional regulator